MIEVSAVVQDSLLGNLFFKKNMPQVIFNKISIPRDDNNEAFFYFKKKLFSQGIRINTHDLVKNKKIDIEMHFFNNFHKSNNIINIKTLKKYCIWPEAPEIHENNKKKLLSNYFDKIFTTFDDDIDYKKFFSVKYPIIFKDVEADGFKNRKNLICILSSNKNLAKYCDYSGYEQRVKIIEWFEENKKKDLNLYGVGWDSFVSSNYFLNRYLGKFLGPFYKKNMYVHKGITNSKSKIYRSHRFSICYENTLGKNGYFCELIFDSLNNGCVPVYWGCPNVAEYLPENCFIDRRKFSSNGELYYFLKNMSEKFFLDYQYNIKKFLKSQNAKIFSLDSFTNIIIKHIKKDFK